MLLALVLLALLLVPGALLGHDLEVALALDPAAAGDAFQDADRVSRLESGSLGIEEAEPVALAVMVQVPALFGAELVAELSAGLSEPQAGRIDGERVEGAVRQQHDREQAFGVHVDRGRTRLARLDVDVD